MVSVPTTHDSSSMRATVSGVFRARELLLALTVANLRLRYRRAMLGFFWSLLNPLLVMCIFTLVFSFLLRFGIKDYPLFFLAGFLPWLFLANVLSESANVFPSHEALIKKACFARAVLPVSVVLANLVHFLLSLTVFLPFLFWMGRPVTAQFALLPLAIVLELAFVLGLGLFLATLNVFCRDVGQMLNILLMLWMYVSPVFYPVSMVPPEYMGFYRINPMVPLLELYRAALLGEALPPAWDIGYVLLWAVIGLPVAWLVFALWEPGFAKEV